MRSVVPVWLLTLLGVVAVGVLVPAADYLVFLPVLLGLAMLVTFGAQMLEPVRKGYVDRVAASLTGAVVILGLSTIVLAPLAFASGATI
ncbi:MAG: hypothetical protein Q7T71_01900 [Herbiconiux sp.]|nr:hypothetical protein [Herbiconiux sp.]